MEELLLSYEEHKLLKKHKINLESSYDVQIILPDDLNDSYCLSDVILASISGVKQNIDYVKNFLEKRIQERELTSDGRVMLKTIPVVTLSESDSESVVSLLSEPKTKKRKKRRNIDKVNAHILQISRDNINDAISCNLLKTEPKKQKVEVRLPAAAEFIPLFSNNRVTKTENMTKNGDGVQDDSLIILSDDEAPIPRPIPKDPKLLRPIVIDGSNVAREHGKVQNTYSAKGIQISIEFFLKRGHTQVTAFVPLYRRHCINGPVATTDPAILEELSKKQQVVFTPSRRIDGKRMTCYDDRFIVELASKNGGVILSNDNYKDLIDDSEEFKKTIKERLLMFCFVGDLLMIPSDPLGRHGPKLEEFLSFPSTPSEPSSSSSTSAEESSECEVLIL